MMANSNIISKLKKSSNQVFTAWRVYQHIESKLKSIGIGISNMRLRLFITILVDGLTKNPYDVAVMNDQIITLDETTEKLLGFETLLMSSYMIVLSYDDFVEKYNLQAYDILEQLSHCIAGFLSAQMGDQNLSTEKLKSIGRFWGEKVPLWFDNPEAQLFMTKLFEFRFLERFGDSFSLGDIYYDLADRSLMDQINMTILAGIELGKAYSRTEKLIKESIYDKCDLTWNLEFFLSNFTRASWGQINSPQQRVVEDINWKSFIEMDYHKSNLLLDCINCLREIINQKRLIAMRFNRVRHCEQFLDDVQDYFADNREGVLGFLHMELISQGQLAEQLLLNLESFGAMNKDFVAIFIEVLHRYGYSPRYDGTLICFNDELMKFCEDDSFVINENNCEKFIRALMMETEHSRKMDLIRLLESRKNRYEKFVAYWKVGNYRECQKILFQSQIPRIMVRSFIRFIGQEKDNLLELFLKHSDSWKFWAYYLAMLAIMYNFLFRYSLDMIPLNLLSIFHQIQKDEI